MPMAGELLKTIRRPLNGTVWLHSMGLQRLNTIWASCTSAVWEFRKTSIWQCNGTGLQQRRLILQFARIMQSYPPPVMG